MMNIVDKLGQTWKVEEFNSITMKGVISRENTRLLVSMVWYQHSYIIVWNNEGIPTLDNTPNQN